MHTSSFTGGNGNASVEQEGGERMRLIDADKLITYIREWYCKDCEKLMGVKKGKLRKIYEIGEAPCRACWVDDMVDEIDNAPVVLKIETEEDQE